MQLSKEAGQPFLDVDRAVMGCHFAAATLECSVLSVRLLS